jgi:hypothetical protein
MHKYPRYLTLFLSLSVVVMALLTRGAPTRAEADRWIQVGLPGESVDALAIHPTASGVLYAGTTDGVFKTINGGGIWKEANTGLTKLQVFTLAMDLLIPDTLYVAVVHDGLFKTTNGGGLWAPAQTGMTNTQIYALAFHPTVTDTLYAGTWGGGVFKSVNGVGLVERRPERGLPGCWLSYLITNGKNVVSPGGVAGRRSTGPGSVVIPPRPWPPKYPCKNSSHVPSRVTL